MIGNGGISTSGRRMLLRLSLLAAVWVPVADAEVTVYPAPAGEQLSTDYTVTADGQDVPVYVALGQEQYGGNYSFCNFDFKGAVSVVVTTSKDLSNLAIQPSHGMEPHVSGNKATLWLTEPRYISFEPDGRNGALLIFANPPEVDPPKQGDAGVVYYGCGIHNGDIGLSGGQTLYLAGGAVVKGAVACYGDNITIRGRGILCGNPWGWKGRGGFHINFDSRSNIRIEGITIRGSWVAAMWPRGNNYTYVNNVKVCNGRFTNEDAMSSYNSANVFVEDCFFRSDDDCLPIKDRSRNIQVSNCVVWCDRARAICVGEESNPGYCEDILFSNIDIIHYGMWPLWFHPANGLVHRRMRLENIRIGADGGDGLFYMVPNNLHWQGGVYPNGSGAIDDIYFCNISIDNPNAQMRILGFDNSRKVSNVTFNHVTRNGELWTRQTTGTEINEHTYNIQFIDTVTPGEATSLTISPLSGRVIPGKTFQFSVVAKGQAGFNLSPQPLCTWTVSGGGGIDNEGLFTARDSEFGAFMVIARTEVDGITLSDTAEITVFEPAGGAISMIRYYPRDGWSVRMVGGVFEGSNGDAEAGPYATLHEITVQPPDRQWTEVALDPSSVPFYKYLRYRAPEKGFGNVSEIEFYSDEEKLTGAPFGTPGSWEDQGKVFTMALDGNVATYFDSDVSDFAFVGIELAQDPAAAERYLPARSEPYPKINVAGGNLRVSRPGTFTVGLYSARGTRVLLRSAEFDLPIPINNLPAGIYMLSINGDTVGRFCRTVVVR